MEKLLEIIANKKLTFSFENNDIKTFYQIAAKLYKKAREAQDKKEYLLAECLKYSRGESIDIESAMSSYKEIYCQEFALKKRSDIQITPEFLSEKDAIRRFDMKENAYNENYIKCMQS